MSDEAEIYAVYTTRSADKDMEKLPAQERERMDQAIYDLGDDPYPHGSIKIQGSSGYRIRRGDYRAVYEVDEETREVKVTRVRHRREVYR